MRALIAVFVLGVMVAVCQAGEPQATEQDNLIIEKVLQHKYEDGGFTVVDPVTYIHHGCGAAKDFIKSRLRLEEYDLDALLDRLCEKNKTSFCLSIESQPAKGYFIDYDGVYYKYFKKDGGGWDAWYKDHPNAHGRTRISLPAYDEKQGIVLIYLGRRSGGKSGAGYVIAYRYENGELREIGRVMLWIS